MLNKIYFLKFFRQFAGLYKRLLCKSKLYGFWTVQPLNQSERALIRKFWLTVLCDVDVAGWCCIELMTELTMAAASLDFFLTGSLFGCLFWYLRFLEAFSPSARTASTSESSSADSRALNSSGPQLT